MACLTSVSFPLGKRYIPNERNWRKDGTWVQIHDQLRESTRNEHRPFTSLNGYYRCNAQLSY